MAYRSAALCLVIVVIACSATTVAQQIPAGTVLPVMLDGSLDARRAQPGEKISGKLMQDVPLPDGAGIRKGSKVEGHVIRANPAAPGTASRLSLTFDRIKAGKREIGIAVHLRSVASPNQVFEARMPTNAIDDYGSSTSDWNTVQIGGAGVYRGSGEVMQGDTLVGRTTDYGAVSARLIAAPREGCSSGGEREQALWLFSPWACGVYGYSDLKIIRGAGAAPGEIQLESSDNIRIDGGSGWLLKTDGSD